MRADRHHSKLDAILPWRRRETARNTGHKCERSQFSRSYKEARKLERDRQDRDRLRHDPDWN